jgi:hypothetical protein
MHAEPDRSTNSIFFAVAKRKASILGWGCLYFSNENYPEKFYPLEKIEKKEKSYRFICTFPKRCEQIHTIL